MQYPVCVNSPLVNLYFESCVCAQSHLDEEKSLQQKVEEHVSNDFANTREWVRLPP